MFHPFAELLGIKVIETKDGISKSTLEVTEQLYNPNKVLHGGALYSLADTGMGAALVPTLEKGMICATIEIKVNYYRPVLTGTLVCLSKIVNKGRTIANMESSIYNGEKLVATANGNFSIFPRRSKKEK